MSSSDLLFLTLYGRKGASSRYRFLQYFPYFEENGYQCKHEPLFSNKYLERLYETGERPIGSVIRGYLRRLRSLLSVRNYGVVVLEKELLPYVPAFFERKLGQSDIPYIVDYDDAVFHNYDRSSNPLVRFGLKNKIDVVMRESDVVVAGNEYLASRAHEAGASRIETIPTVIDLDRYPYTPPSEDGQFTIGWIGSPSTAQYVESLASELQGVCAKRDAKVVLVGSGEIELPGVPYEVREWSEETEINDIMSFDVGIMPLDADPWERGKCGFKLIQYMGCGKPVVSSPVGVNKEIVENNRNGFLADGSEEWIRALLRLCDNPEERRRFGKRGRETVEREYSIETAFPQWQSIVDSLVDSD